MRACGAGHVDIVQFYVKECGADANAVNNVREPYFLFVVIFVFLEIEQKSCVPFLTAIPSVVPILSGIIRHDDDFIVVRSRFQYESTPLFYATATGSVPIARILVFEGKANPNISNRVSATTPSITSLFWYIWLNFPFQPLIEIYL
jgi:hypothetical protein